MQLDESRRELYESTKGLKRFLGDETRTIFGFRSEFKVRARALNGATLRTWQLYRMEKKKKGKKGNRQRTAGRATKEVTIRSGQPKVLRSLHLDTSLQVSGITNVRAFRHSVHCSHCKYQLQSRVHLGYFYLAVRASSRKFTVKTSFCFQRAPRSYTGCSKHRVSTKKEIPTIWYRVQLLNN